MTGEEAVEYLNTLYMALAVFPNQQISLGNVGKMEESVSLAIEALKQKPDGDAISRQAVIEKINELLKEPEYQHEGEDWRIGLIMAEELINGAPTIIEAEREVDIQEEGSSNFIQLKQDVLNNKQLWRKLREIEDEDSD